MHLWDCGICVVTTNRVCLSSWFVGLFAQIGGEYYKGFGFLYQRGIREGKEKTLTMLLSSIHPLLPVSPGLPYAYEQSCMHAALIVVMHVLFVLLHSRTLRSKVF